MATKGRVKKLNIFNTDRYFNVNLMKRTDIEEKRKITRLNEATIEEEMDLLEARSRKYPVRDTNSYLIFQEKYTNDALIEKVISHGGEVSYYTDTVVPYYVLKQLAMNLESEVIYTLRPEFTEKEQENIELSYMATRVVIDVPIVLPDMSPYDLLFILHPLKTNVDRVQLSFPPLHKDELSERHMEYYEQVPNTDLYTMKPHYKYSFFKYIQTSLSIWKMNIWIVCDNTADYDAMNNFVQKDLSKRSVTRKKVGV